MTETQIAVVTDHASREGREDSLGREADVLNGTEAPEWAWPFSGAKVVA